MKLAAPEIEPVFAGRLLTPFTSDEPGRWLTPAGAHAHQVLGMEEGAAAGAGDGCRRGSLSVGVCVRQVLPRRLVVRVAVVGCRL